MKGSVRRSQLITTYGVGSIVAVEDEAVMVAGLDYWPSQASDEVAEPRLQIGGKRLRLPPGGNGDGFGKKSSGHIPVVRFPRWYYCPDPSCRRLDSFGHLGVERENKCRHCGAGLVPSRFVAVCAHGHIEDFPYWQWVHAGHDVPSGNRHDLTLRVTGSSGSLGGIIVRCETCDLERSLEGAFHRGALVGVKSCGGQRPWLTRESEDCGKQLRTTQRGASNVWFPIVRSALSIPPWSEGVQQFVQQHWTTLRMPLEKPVLEEIVANLVQDEGVDFSVSEVLSAVQVRSGLDADALDDSDIRADEFAALCRGRSGDSRSEFVAEVTAPPASLAEALELVTVVSRLREVRVFTGFTRLSPAGKEVEASPIGRDVKWLPAIPVLGEGVFLKLSEDRLAAWETNEKVDERTARLNERWRGSFFFDEKELTPRFLLAHVFAHAVINQWALSGGYPAASLRERIYAEEGGTGVLIYTAAADSAGSLGGVIAQADPVSLESSVQEAIHRFAWCSSDPVCSETDAQGADGLNLAACHACALLPETSCEHGNRLLDRALLVGLPGDRTPGYFGGLVTD
jgi:hypothetical protein